MTLSKVEPPIGFFWVTLIDHLGRVDIIHADTEYFLDI
jgi:hypothetical protein